ncbi:hypothetical protein VKT23_007586 [Stygiomarasmius scandens]|uniref:Uncharacterized protein n=1 Tax=Marasmiellus scandens TaxID=2682957 RepID=A0ABR1JRH6_9AGAR
MPVKFSRKLDTSQSVDDGLTSLFTVLPYIFSHPIVAAIVLLIICIASIALVIRHYYPCLTVSTLRESLLELKKPKKTYKHQCPRDYYTSFDASWLEIKRNIASLEYTDLYGEWGPWWTPRYWKARNKHVMDAIACHERVKDLHKGIEHALKIERLRALQDPR